MNRPKVSISIDGPLLERIDRVAECRNESRSEALERMARNVIEEEEATITAMESPGVGAILQRLAESPNIMRILATALGEELTPEQIERMTNRTTTIRKVRDRAKSRKGDARGTVAQGG
jgi:hypothetical protein